MVRSATRPMSAWPSCTAGEGGFRNYKPTKGKLVHTWYAYPMETFMAVQASKASQFKCWKDFSGKPVFYSPAGFMNWLNFRRVYKTLGYDFKHVQIDPKTQSDAMQAGTIAGAVAYTTAGRSLVPYWKETEVRMDVAVVNPCPDEVAKLKAGGLSIENVDPKNAFSKNVGVSQIQGVPILFAYNARPDMPEDVVYKILVAFEKNKDKLASIDAGFGPMAKDFVGMQVNGINANPEIAVHRGPRQVPEGEEGLERQVEGRGRRELIGCETIRGEDERSGALILASMLLRAASR